MRAAPFLFASDLDGTLLPNTSLPPAPGCLERTRILLEALREAGCPICFVSGRYFALARKGLASFGLPAPTWWICNVGTEIYDASGRLDQNWQRRLGPPLDQGALWRVLAEISGLRPQEPEKQGPHKFSLYYPGAPDERLQRDILSRVREVDVHLMLVASVEESTGLALLDVLPVGAGKAKALGHVAGVYRLGPDRVFFAGDSGNDLDVFEQGCCGTLVGNTPAQVLEHASSIRAREPEARIFIAQARYGDGIIEALGHYGLWPRPRAGLPEGKPREALS